jgi:hypothetical protein
MLIQKVDEEDGVTLSNVGEFPDSPKQPTEMPDYTSNLKKKASVENNTSSTPVVTEEVVTNTFEKVEIDEDGDGVNDGYDTDGDGDIDEYFAHRNCEHVWGDADGDGFEECQICGLLRSESGE